MSRTCQQTTLRSGNGMRPLQAGFWRTMSLDMAHLHSFGLPSSVLCGVTRIFRGIDVVAADVLCFRVDAVHGVICLTTNHTQCLSNGPRVFFAIWSI